MRVFIIICVRHPEQTDQVACLIEVPPSGLALINNCILKPIGKIFRILPSIWSIEIPDLFKNPVRMEPMSGIDDQGWLERELVQKTQSLFLRRW